MPTFEQTIPPRPIDPDRGTSYDNSYEQAFARGAMAGARQRHYFSWLLENNQLPSDAAYAASNAAFDNAMKMLNSTALEFPPGMKVTGKNIAKLAKYRKGKGRTTGKQVRTSMSLGDVVVKEAEKKAQRFSVAVGEAASGGDASARRVRAAVRSGIAGPAAVGSGSGLGDILSEYGYWKGVEIEQGKERTARLSTTFNRRGAAATRVVQSPATPGRTGAKSTRAYSDASGTGMVARSTASAGAKGTAKGLAGGQSVRAAGRLTTKQAAASVGGTAVGQRSTTGHAPAFADLSLQAQGALSQINSQFLSGSGVRMRSGPGSRQTPRVSSTFGGELAGTGLTSLEAGGVGFGLQQASIELPPSRRKGGCDCPPKRKKSSEPRCVNPVIEKKLDGDVLTIKRKIKCPSSSKK